MSVFDDYFETITPEEKTEFERIRSIVREMVPTFEEGMSYGMPAYLYKEKAFLGTMAGKKFLSLYPYSGKTLAKLADKLEGYEQTPGSLHFSLEKPLPEELIKEIIETRLKEIEGRLA
jgi:uncharacterized protein YdhG (YjbR/CyaY superfamily)